jgi:hypothetical protein
VADIALYIITPEVMEEHVTQSVPVDHITVGHDSFDIVVDEVAAEGVPVGEDSEGSDE